MSLLTPAEMASTYGGTGTYSSAEVQMAIDLAEFDIIDALGTFLIPTAVANEEFMWPYSQGKHMLRYSHINSITTVTAKHSLDCDCEWTIDTECGVILDRENSIVRLVACNLSLSNCLCGINSVQPERAVVTYNAGLTAAETDSTTQQGKAIRMAIAMRAQEWLPVVEDAANWGGDFLIVSWNSMDYGERREFGTKWTNNPLGPGALSQAAWRIINRIKPYRALFLRGTGKI